MFSYMWVHVECSEKRNSCIKLHFNFNQDAEKQKKNRVLGPLCDLSPARLCCNILQLLQKSGGNGACLIFLWIYPMQNADFFWQVSFHTERAGARILYDPVRPRILSTVYVECMVEPRRLSFIYCCRTYFSRKRVIVTYLLTPRSIVLLQNLTVFQLVKKSPPIYGTRRFITTFTSARHLSLSWARSIQLMIPHSPSWRSLLILSFHLRLGFPGDLFPSGYLTKVLHTIPLLSIWATCPAYLINIDLLTRTPEYSGWKVRSLSSSWCSFYNSPVTSSFLGPNIPRRRLVTVSDDKNHRVYWKWFRSVWYESRFV